MRWRFWKGQAPDESDSESDTPDPRQDPLTLAVNRAFNTGEWVYWQAGDPLPEPEGTVRPIKEDDPRR